VKCGRQRGLTLLELLIATTLLAITLSLAYAALNTAMRSDDKVEAVIERSESLRSSEAFLRRQLAAIRPLYAAENARGITPLLFDGHTDQLQFIAPVPVRQPQLAGLQAFRLSLADDQLLLQMQSADDFGEASTAAARRLVQLVDARFEYYGRLRSEESAGWHDDWNEHGHLPRMIGLRWTEKGREARWVFAVPSGVASGGTRR
jgi:general secretion pathway protein J